jgi:phospholipid-translocating ATPase
LAVASKKMSEEDYLQFMAAYNEASQAMTNREKKVKGVYSSLESNLNLLGAIAVEDKLQEDVKETLVRLEAAGIKVWVLTGDKKETAINISFSCGHFERDMQIVDIANNDANTVGSALEAGLAKSGSDASKK